MDDLPPSLSPPPTFDPNTSQIHEKSPFNSFGYYVYGYYEIMALTNIFKLHFEAQQTLYFQFYNNHTIKTHIFPSPVKAGLSNFFWFAALLECNETICAIMLIIKVYILDSGGTSLIFNSILSLII
jgi:hypothetical protein